MKYIKPLVYFERDESFEQDIYNMNHFFNLLDRLDEFLPISYYQNPNSSFITIMHLNSDNITVLREVYDNRFFVGVEDDEGNVMNNEDIITVHIAKELIKDEDEWDDILHNHPQHYKLLYDAMPDMIKDKYQHLKNELF